MKLTRKHLNLILVSLPHPKKVVDGAISPIYKVVVADMLSVIPHDINFRADEAIKTKELTFEFSYEQMDWVLKDLDI